MKPIEELSNTEKAKLLHELFPNEIPGLLAFTANMSLTLAEEADSQRAHWQNGLFTFDFWLSLAQDAHKRIQRYQPKMRHNSSLFADQLFDGYLALYLTYCLMLYTIPRKHPNTQFVKAADLLFDLQTAANEHKG